MLLFFFTSPARSCPPNSCNLPAANFSFSFLKKKSKAYCGCHFAWESINLRDTNRFVELLGGYGTETSREGTSNKSWVLICSLSSCPIRFTANRLWMTGRPFTINSEPTVLWNVTPADSSLIARHIYVNCSCWISRNKRRPVGNPQSNSIVVFSYYCLLARIDHWSQHKLRES
jgi:hypothetical protein